MTKNPYQTLGLQKEATKDQIVKAYRKKVKKAHPDKNGGKESEEFLAIQAAWEILSDDQKRKQWDETGTVGEKKNEDQVCLTQLAELSIQVVADLREWKTKDVLKIIREITESQLAGSRKTRQDNLDSAVKFADAAQRFTAKGEQENAFSKMMLHRSEEHTKAAEAIGERIVMLTKCLELLAGYSYRTDQTDPLTQRWISAGFHVVTVPRK